MNNTKIDWADSTWNPVTGCLHECPYCYAKKMVARFASASMTSKGVYSLDLPVTKTDDPNSARDPYPFGFAPTFHRYRLNEYARKKCRTVFVCSMADLFGMWVPDEWVLEVLKSCRQSRQHRYLFLTKNPVRYLYMALNGDLPFERDFWYGQTALTAADWYGRLPHKMFNTFCSIEPLVSEFGWFKTRNPPNWVIVGAETGQRKEKVVPQKIWVQNIAYQCKELGIPIFMKESLRELMGDEFVQKKPWYEVPHETGG